MMSAEAIHFCHPGKWSQAVSHFDTSNPYIIQPTWLLILARRSFHSVTVRDEKLQPEDIYHCGVFKMDKELYKPQKITFLKQKKPPKNCVPGTEAAKSQPSAAQIPVIPLTLTLMCFSLDRPAWNTGRVTWHYKCLFIKLSPQVILLGSCVFVHSFSLFSHFSEIR